MSEPIPNLGSPAWLNMDHRDIVRDGASELAAPTGSVALLPCPFCGTLEEPQAKHDHLIVDGLHALQCWNCKAVGPFTVAEDMVGHHWNRREQPWNGSPNSELRRG